MKAQFFSFFSICLLLAACAQSRPSPVSATLFIVNNSEQPLCKVHLTSYEGEQLDVVLVSMDQPLAVGENVQMKVPTESQLNLSVEDCEGNFLESVKGLHIPIEGLSYHVGGGN